MYIQNELKAFRSTDKEAVLSALSSWAGIVLLAVLLCTDVHLLLNKYNCSNFSSLNKLNLILVLFLLELTWYALNQFHNAKFTVLFREGLSSGIKSQSNKISFTLMKYLLPRGFLVSIQPAYRFILSLQRNSRAKTMIVYMRNKPTFAKWHHLKSSCVDNMQMRFNRVTGGVLSIHCG